MLVLLNTRIKDKLLDALLHSNHDKEKIPPYKTRKEEKSLSHIKIEFFFSASFCVCEPLITTKKFFFIDLNQNVYI